MRTVLLICGAVALLLVGVLLGRGPLSTSPQVQPADQVGAPGVVQGDDPAADAEARRGEPDLIGRFEAVRVVDGDTLVMRGLSGPLAGEEVRLRLAIVDTPEVGECGADEATRFVEQWLGDRARRFDLRRPADAPARDRFDRVLGEVLGEPDADGRRDSLNVALVSEGLGRIDERFTHEDADLADRLRSADRVAAVGPC